MTPVEKQKETKHILWLRKYFNTDSIEEALGPDVLECRKSINCRFMEVGITKHINRFKRDHIPQYLKDRLYPFQQDLMQKEKAQKLMSTTGYAYAIQRPDVKDKIRSTCISRYGTPYAISTDSVREKAKQTFISKYGVENNLQRPGMQELVRQVHLNKHGKRNHLALDPSEILRRLEAQNLEPLISIDRASDEYKGGIPVRCKLCGHEFTTKLDVSGTYLSKQFGGNAFRCCECQNRGTKLQDFVRDYIRSLGYTCRQWSHIDWMKNQEIDCYVEELSIGFEVNGYLTHNAESNPYGDDPKDKTFHQFKSQACLEHGISLYHIWHYANSDREQLIAKSIVDRAIDIATSGHLSGVNPGDKLNRDTLPNPLVIGLPYTELPPEPFDSPNGICYNSGYWQF